MSKMIFLVILFLTTPLVTSNPLFGNGPSKLSLKRYYYQMASEKDHCGTRTNVRLIRGDFRKSQHFLQVWSSAFEIPIRWILRSVHVVVYFDFFALIILYTLHKNMFARWLECQNDSLYSGLLSAFRQNYWLSIQLPPDRSRLVAVERIAHCTFHFCNKESFFFTHIALCKNLTTEDILFSYPWDVNYVLKYRISLS